MALDQQRDYHNCKPPTPTPHTGTVTFQGDGGSGTISNIIRHYWNEVGNGTNSSFPGVGEGPIGENTLRSSKKRGFKQGHYFRNRGL